MKYIRYEFLELFDSEEIIDQEAAMFRYLKICKPFTFILTIFQYDDFATIRLMYDDTQTPIFELGIENGTEIKIKKHNEYTAINFFRTRDTEPFISVLIEPNISLNADLK